MVQSQADSVHQELDTIDSEVLQVVFATAGQLAMAAYVQVICRYIAITKFKYYLFHRFYNKQ
jgi:hypothetical protein